MIARGLDAPRVTTSDSEEPARGILAGSTAGGLVLGDLLGHRALHGPPEDRGGDCGGDQSADRGGQPRVREEAEAFLVPVSVHVEIPVCADSST